MIEIFEIAMTAYMGACAMALVALVSLMVLHRRDAERTRTEALSYVRVGRGGTRYAVDPQTGTLHRLDDLLVKYAIGERPDVTPRQHRKIRRRVRQALGA